MTLIHQLIELYVYILIITAVMSWVPVRDHNGSLAQIKRVLASLTEPVLRPIRSILPRPSAGGVSIDFSVWIAIILFQVINAVL